MEKVQAKKSLGQNFLKDENILLNIAEAVDVTKDDLIIEIGPGKGALTKYLSKKECDLLCYEIDKRMDCFLEPFVSEKVKIIYGDFLEANLKKDIIKPYQNIYVVANIPYYITTPIIEHLMTSGLVISAMVLLVQKEVALRFSAKPKSKDYGYFTVYLQHYFDIKRLFDVSPKCFSPEPKVVSSVICLKRKDKIVSIDEKNFFAFLKKAFQQKRKTLHNNLKDYAWEKIRLVLEKKGFSLNVRAEEIPYEVFVQIYEALN